MKGGGPLTLGERIKKVRKALDLTQQEFCDRIGLKRNSISLVESDKRNPSKQLFLAICREFNVNEQWLRTGEGEMFLTLDEDSEFDQISTQIQLSEDDFIKGLIRSYWQLPDDKKAVIRELIDGIYEK